MLWIEDLTYATNFFPGGPKGVARKLNIPNIYEYAYSFELLQAVMRTLRVMLASSIMGSHSVNRNSGSTLAKIALIFVYIWIARSAKLRQWECSGTN